MKRMIHLLFFCLIFSSLSSASTTRRVISLAPDLTEILYVLGVEDQLIATSEHSDFPPGAQKKPTIGSFISPNIEKILFFNPDLVICRSGATPLSVINQLKRTNIEVLSFWGRDENDIYETLEVLGKTFHKEKKSKEVIHHIKRQIKTIRIQNHRGRRIPTVLIQIEEIPLIVAGQKTLPHRAIELAGGKNAAFSYSYYPKLQHEIILKLNPDIIIIPSLGDNPKKTEKIIDHWKRWKNLTAVDKKQIHVMNGDLISRATPRFIEGVNKLFLIIKSIQK